MHKDKFQAAPLVPQVPHHHGVSMRSDAIASEESAQRHRKVETPGHEPRHGRPLVDIGQTLGGRKGNDQSMFLNLLRRRPACRARNDLILVIPMCQNHHHRRHQTDLAVQVMFNRHIGVPIRELMSLSTHKVTMLHTTDGCCVLMEYG